MVTKSIDDVLDKYSDLVSQIVFVTNININEEPFRYKVVFEVKKKNGYVINPVAEVAPELLHKKYKIGSKFKNGRQIGYADYISIESFDIDNRKELYTCKISDVIDGNDIKIIDFESVYNTVLKQNCYYIENDDYDLIIPHYTVANHFHFRSSSLKHAILEDTFYSLYVKNSFKRIDEDKVVLRVKNKANQCDLKTICNFLDNEYAFKSFKYYSHQQKKAKTAWNYCQIMSRFPIQGVFNIKTICRQINKTGKPKILILGIYQDDFIYPFKEINYKIDKSINVNGISINEPKSSGRKKPQFISGKIKNRTPSNVYVINNEVFMEKEFVDINDIRLNPEFIGEPTNKQILLDKLEGQVDGSYGKGKKNGDVNTQQNSQSTSTEGNKKLDIFNINNFDKLFNSLISHNEVENSFLSDNLILKKKADARGKIPPKYYIREDIVRSYKYGNFKFNNKRINVIEIEAGGSWRKTTTWFFVLNNEEEKFDVNDIVFSYIGGDKILEEIEKDLYEKKRIIFIRKYHPKKLDKQNIFDWTKRTLELILEKMYVR